MGAKIIGCKYRILNYMLKLNLTDKTCSLEQWLSQNGSLLNKVILSLQFIPLTAFTLHNNFTAPLPLIKQCCFVHAEQVILWTSLWNGRFTFTPKTACTTEHIPKTATYSSTLTTKTSYVQQNTRHKQHVQHNTHHSLSRHITLFWISISAFGIILFCFLCNCRAII